MADTETDQILDGIEPPAADTTAGDAGADTVAGDAQDTAAGDGGEDTTVADAGADSVEGEGGEDTVAGDEATETATTTTQASTAPPDDATYKLAVTALETLQKQQSDLDDEFEQLDKNVADGTLADFDAGPKIQLLTSRQGRLERKIALATKTVAGHEQAIAQHKAQAMDAHWRGLGTKYADIAETPAKATEAIKDIWDEEYAKAQKALPGAHPERIAGKAEAAWENRIAVLRAQKGTAKPGTTRTAKPPGRLTPSGGTAPTSPAKENAAVIAERTLGPLNSYKF